MTIERFFSMIGRKIQKTGDPMKSIPWYKRIPIQIPLILLLVTLIPTVAFGIRDRQVTRQAQLQDAQRETQERLRETALLLQTVMQEVEATARELAEQASFLDLAAQYQRQAESRLASQLTLALGQSAWPCPSMSALYLVLEQADCVFTSLPSQKQISITQEPAQSLVAFYQEYAKGQATWTTFPGTGPDGQEIVYWRPLRSSDGSLLGALACQMDSAHFADAVSALRREDGAIGAITTYPGRVLCCTDPQEAAQESLAGSAIFSQAYREQENTGSYFTEDGDWLVAHYNSLENGWKFLCAVPSSQIFGAAGGWAYMLVLSLSGLASVLLGSLLLFRLVIRPLGRLRGKMEKMEKGQLETLDSYGTENEIGIILRAYDHMVVRLRQLINDVYVQQLLRKQAQLSSLQSQMDEHFLYNTLNTIYCQASQEQAPTSAAMILQLSRYFRLNLSQGQEKIPLPEILELIQAYLKIQQMRYGQSLACRLETFPEMDLYVSLKYLYQPIIENAIVHGFEKKLGSHHLDISFQNEGGCLRFAVRDDGVGMSPERCQEVTAELKSFDPIRGKGYALRNIQEQIRLTYGPEYGIQIESRQGEGTTVTLVVPLERRKSQ